LDVVCLPAGNGNSTLPITLDNSTHLPGLDSDSLDPKPFRIEVPGKKQRLTGQAEKLNISL